MQCAFCNDDIGANAIKQGGEMFCSLECANQAAGYDSNIEDGYYEEDSLMMDHFEDFEE